MQFPGWILVGRYPEGDDDGVGCWILHHGGEAAVLEFPPGESLVADVIAILQAHQLKVKYLMASHDHEDHWDESVWNELQNHPACAQTQWLPFLPDQFCMKAYDLGGEPLWRVHAPKHSRTDATTIFRGVAMTGDVELGRYASRSGEVAEETRRDALHFLASFEEVNEYHLHTLVSAHLNDLRTFNNWKQQILPPS
jgi:glyoxylase-like metal-dependent hydrolase (beta-lactamase superfamily II)